MSFDADQEYDEWKTNPPLEFEEEPTRECIECGALLFDDDVHCDCEYCDECGELRKNCICLEEM